MGASAEESVLGVLTSLRHGLAVYDLFLTNRRIVAARVGGPLTAMYGGGAVGKTLSNAGEDRRRTRYASLSPAQILAGGKKNFEISYPSITRALFNAGISGVSWPTLTLWLGGRKMAFLFASGFLGRDRAELQSTNQLLASVLGHRPESKHV